MSEFRGARGSNTGDDFHELWAARQAIRLLMNEDGLMALAVEGLAARDEAGVTEDTWDGVDCTQYFGGLDAKSAKSVVIEQLKYSGATPNSVWSVARLVSGKRRDQSVIARLAKAWKGLAELRPDDTAPVAALISNQPIDPCVISAFSLAAATSTAIPKTKPKDTATSETKLAYATGLNSEEFKAFSAAIRFEGGAGSRFALEEQVLRAIANWTDQDVQSVVTGLRQFVRHRMRPEFAGELITRESMILHLGASEGVSLFPCPSEISLTKSPVSRTPIREATRLLLSGVQHLCLHGRGGVGKTTALQEIEAELPTGSIMIKYDCYGSGRYMDPSALRHRSSDAFLQLTNELATRLKLPLLLSRNQGTDYPRLFANRLKHAASAVAAQQSEALIVIAIDAADNAVTAAQNRIPVEESFIHDFVLLSELPENVRFVITSRTGRQKQLRLPSSYHLTEIEPFNRPETGDNVSRIWTAPESWIDDFHHLSSGEKSRLQLVNKSPIPRSPSNKSTKRYFPRNDEERRFKFDSLDTLPYWYQPLLRAFANVNGKHFLQAVEHWIIDVWGYSGDIRDFNKERRHRKFGESSGSLSNHRHGSIPTLERLNTHLEWHAMWCAAGELMKTEPLVSRGDDEWDDWGELGSRIMRKKLTEPPLWSMDLLVSTPLIARNWRADVCPLDEWVDEVGEAYHREEMFPDDKPEYVVVDGYTVRRMEGRTETTRIASALVAPDSGSSLLRALQTVDDNWDYKLPEEGEDHEIDQEPYQLFGWLRCPEQDNGIDDTDPLRGFASFITALPGRFVTEACNLTRDKNIPAGWGNDSVAPPMFMYEAWGEEDSDYERYSPDLNTAGRRLLVNREQLQEFLHGQGLDLIIEVEVIRRGSENRRYTGEEEDEKQEGRFDRLYRLHAGGALEIAEGCISSWTGDRPRT